MTMITVRRLIWDDWNIKHITRHGIIPEDIEEVCRGDFVVRQTYQGRIMLIGPNASGSLLSAVLAPREPKEEDTFYVVTARPAARRNAVSIGR